MTKGLLSLTLLCALGSSGCLYVTAAQSVKGRAWVVRSELVGSSFWNCDATNGDPVCYQTVKVAGTPNATASAKGSANAGASTND
jgi:hypothetical protein